LNIHEILPLHDAIFGLLVPLLIACIAYGAAMLAAKKSHASAWAAPLATGFGFTAACIGISGGMPGFPPAETIGWICYASALLAIVAAVTSRFLPQRASIGLALLASAAVMWLVTGRARVNQGWTNSQTVMYLGIFTAGATILSACIDLLAQRMSAAFTAVVLGIIVASVANVFGMTGSASLAKETGAVGLTLMAAWTVALIEPHVSLRGIGMVLGPVLTGVMVLHLLYSYSEGTSPLPAMCILAGIPVLLCLTTMQWMRRRPRWQFLVVNLMVAVIPAAIAMSMVAIPFMKSMREGTTESM
jgi:hypothetical protein